MKKLMTLMLGMSLAFGTAAVSFAQDKDTPKKEDGKKKDGKGDKKAPKKDEEKKKS